MSCTDIETRLVEGDAGPDVTAHLEGCEACRQFARDVGGVLAATPLSPDDRAALSSLEADTWRAWQQAQVRARPSWLGYAAAAGLGALVASGFWSARPAREIVVERVVEAPAAVLVAEADEPNLSPDEVFFEVTWPDFPEGETP
jgi:hypothetical protein